MLFTFVSRWNGAGKDYAASVIEGRWKRGVEVVHFTHSLYKAASAILGGSEGRSKYDLHPELGVSLKEVNHIISKALTDRNPELPVYRAKKDIEFYVESGYHVVTTDARRLREFQWLDDVTSSHGTRHHIIEIVPTGMQYSGTSFDTWTNGTEPCGYEVWAMRRRELIRNDGTKEFASEVERTVERLMQEDGE